MLFLPVCGAMVEFSLPDGADDLAVLETQGSVVAQGLAILTRLARVRPKDPVAERAWSELTVTDFEYALLALRARLLGDRIACAFDCLIPGCGERVEAEFRSADLLAEVRPRRPRGLIAEEERPGWFRLLGEAAAFRLPTAGDQAKVIGRAQAVQRLQELCIDPPEIGARKRARIEIAMEQLAPPVSRPIAGRCPACGGALTASLHVPRLVTAELKAAIAGVYDEIHLIARAYQWSEAGILALPRLRRQRYAERIRLQQRAA